METCIKSYQRWLCPAELEQDFSKHPSDTSWVKGVNERIKIELKKRKKKINQTTIQSVPRLKNYYVGCKMFCPWTKLWYTNDLSENTWDELDIERSRVNGISVRVVNVWLGPRLNRCHDDDGMVTTNRDIALKRCQGEICLDPSILVVTWRHAR